MFFKKSFPFIQQQNTMDCGLACVAMIAKYYGRNYSLLELLSYTTLTKNGLYAQDISRVAESLGFRTLLIKVNSDELKKQVSLPCIVHWNSDHYITVYKIKNDTVFFADPSMGLSKCSFAEFKNHWYDQEEKGFVLLLEPTPHFFNNPVKTTKTNKATLNFILKYVVQYKLYFYLILVSLFLGCLLQFILPFLTQWIIDYGITVKDKDFVYLAAAVLMIIYLSSTLIDFIRSRLLIHLSTRVNIFIISDFLIKLMNLPLSFFDSRFKGDLIQRIRDHDRIERFLTDTLLRSFFSVFSVIIFSIALCYYNAFIFGLFAVFTGMEIGWIFIYLKKMRVNDNKVFHLMSEDQSKLYEIINGIQEIKLNNIEKKVRWEWERIQAGLFKENVEKLTLSQRQNGGAKFFSYSLLVAVNLVGALLVIQNKISMGSLIAILFTLNQLNAPISQILSLILQGYSAKFSLERLGEIYEKNDDHELISPKVSEIPDAISIILDNVSFSFTEDIDQCTLKNISLVIPAGKTTAIVGMSGSGKTTLIKLLLKFYSPLSGRILIGDNSLEEINSTSWRDKCGSVLQDSFIFSDSIAGNIALDEFIDGQKLDNAVKMANIHTFITSLPLKYQTRIGENGIGISQGQKQRILIARAIYKNPDIIFFDEATNALDANNEKVIMQNLSSFFQGKTVIISAHRLSTVKNADQIILIDEGKIIEVGSHQDLLAHKHKYYQLVENQLTLM